MTAEHNIRPQASPTDLSSSVASAERSADNRIRLLHFIANSEGLAFFRRIAQHTDHEQYHLHVGALDHPGRLQSGLRELGITAFALGAPRRYQYPLAILRLAQWLRRNHIDVIQVHLFEASIVGIVAARLARVPLVVFSGHHSHEVPFYRSRLLLESDRIMARTLGDHIIAPSRQMRDTFVSLYRCPPQKIQVIHHGLDLEHLDPARADGRRFRAEHGLGNKVVLGAICRYFWVKNLPTLVRAFATLAQDDRNLALVIVGGAGDSAYLQSLIRDMAVADRVLLLGQRHDIPEVLAAFDIFVHPAIAESFGFVIAEAMAMGRPVVTTPVGIAEELVTHGVSGVLAKGTDVEALRRALLDMFALRAQWTLIGTEARRRALRLTPRNWVRAHERCYKHWLAQSVR